MSEKYEIVESDHGAVSLFSIGNCSTSKICKFPPATLIIIGPGNPGPSDFYIPFARLLHEKTRLPVWAHSFVEHGTGTPFNGIESKHGLLAQIDLKKDLIRKYLKGVGLICVDHSTSCYITLKLLQEPDIGSQIIDAYFLMPVFSKPDSRKAEILHWCIRSFFIVHSIELLAYIFCHVSTTWQRRLDAFYHRFAGYKGVPYRTDRFLQPGAAKKISCLGEQLFSLKFDMAPLIEFSDRLHIFSSKNDDLLGSWINDLKKLDPSFDIQIHDQVPHVFFIDHSEIVAQILAEKIAPSDKKKNNKIMR